ncbi:altronate dehydratase [Pedobacter sp. BS3]|uniref:UxaA family hydrolase n=1 Tax=Pedobacter sp. BS3 TaxID=2567937 RepID=UPI0011EFC946|nr:altronate dehydratase family protein [Pedobacter sp. BS3]TZF84934.1 altronate dehydratase [Pedobacter sp. BS3]
MSTIDTDINSYLQIHPKDNVLVALRDLPENTLITFNGYTFSLVNDVSAKHKFAIKPFAAGDNIYMYGVLVGRATADIPSGGLLTTQNIVHATNDYAVKERNLQWTKPDVSKWQNRHFMGFHRANGAVGTANYWLVIPLVFCENRNIRVLQSALLGKLGYQKYSEYETAVDNIVAMYRAGRSADEILNADLQDVYVENNPNRLFPNIDGIKFLTHEMGCGGTRLDSDALCGLLAGYITHPNVAGATVLSLGCQHAQASILKKEIKKRDPGFSKPLVVLEQQAEGTEKQLLQKAIKRTFTGLMEANRTERKPAPLSRLCVGLECGGSDGFSGISANPAVGYASDLLVSLGASVILSEFPELCGVEQELSDRCISEDLANRFTDLMKTYNKRAEETGSGFYANPSPGNVRDGLITDAIKSAGAAKKGGTSPIVDVLDYPEKVTQPGLSLLCTPGNDVESTTAEVAAGANIVLFTTGLGTPTGNPITPVLKLSTNTSLYKRMPDIIDIDCGTIIDGIESIEQVAEHILETIIRVASGEQEVKAMKLGQDDFIPWKRGVSL